MGTLRSERNGWTTAFALAALVVVRTEGVWERECAAACTFCLRHTKRALLDGLQVQVSPEARARPQASHSAVLLQHALDEAGSDDVLCILSESAQPIYLGGRQLTANRSVVLRGSGSPERVLFDCGRASRLLSAMNGSSLLTLEGFDVQRGVAGCGGAVASSARLRVADVHFRDCSASSDPQSCPFEGSAGKGGAVFVFGTSIDTRASSFSRCNARDSGGAIAAGELAFVAVHVTTFSACTAAYGHGGAVKLMLPSSVPARWELKGVSFTNCMAPRGYGGAMVVFGQPAASSSVAVRGATVDGCSATIGGGIALATGGDAVAQAWVVSCVACSSVSAASGGSCVALLAGARVRGGSWTVEACSAVGATSAAAGGAFVFSSESGCAEDAVWAVRDIRVEEAALEGGGPSQDGGAVTFTSANGVVDNCTWAAEGVALRNVSAGESGGGVAFTQLGPVHGSVWTVSNVSAANVRAPAGTGGAVYLTCAGDLVEAALAVDGVRVDGVAAGAGGAVGVNIVGDSDRSSVSVTRVTVRGTRALDGPGGLLLVTCRATCRGGRWLAAHLLADAASAPLGGGVLSLAASAMRGAKWDVFDVEARDASAGPSPTPTGAWCGLP